MNEANKKEELKEYVLYIIRTGCVVLLPVVFMFVMLLLFTDVAGLVFNFICSCVLICFFSYLFGRVLAFLLPID